MKFLLAAINAKYIHSNLGVYSLKAYAQNALIDKDVRWEIDIGEYTINHQMELILKDIYKRQPDAVGFSCYIWNINYVLDLVRDLHKVLPEVKIWLGGPEVSYHAFEILQTEPFVDGIMIGEGEETFAGLLRCLPNLEPFSDEIHGLAYRKTDGSIQVNPPRQVMDMNRIPFSYEDLTGFENKIIYYESSRGCPFSCSYCLSSIDRSVRFRDPQTVKKELDFFLEHKVPQVKFVDRTFNCKKSHSMEIWKHITEHDNGITNFHFEISADILSSEELDLISQMRPGLIQLEIGVQTTNPQTITEIRRTMDLDRLKQVVSQISQYHNVHQHLDLIAGLPYEDYQSFGHSFNEVYAMKPDQLQLGFLKVLRGSHMADMAQRYGLFYKSQPPYEVLATRWLSYADILRLKSLEDMVEVYYNSGQFGNTIRQLSEVFETPFQMFERIADYYEEQKLFGVSHNRLARYEILFHFIEEQLPGQIEEYRDLLIYDLYLRENVKSRPAFARDQTPYKQRVRQLFLAEAASPEYLSGYEAYDSRQISKMAHIEVMGDGKMVLFDYLNRDPLSYNARAIELPG